MKPGDLYKISYPMNNVCLTLICADLEACICVRTASDALTSELCTRKPVVPSWAFGQLIHSESDR